MQCAMADPAARLRGAGPAGHRRAELRRRALRARLPRRSASQRQAAVGVQPASACAPGLQRTRAAGVCRRSRGAARNRRPVPSTCGHSRRPTLPTRTQRPCMPDAAIVSYARTPIGKAFRGALNLTHGATLGRPRAAPRRAARRHRPRRSRGCRARLRLSRRRQRLQRGPHQRARGRLARAGQRHDREPLLLVGPAEHRHRGAGDPGAAR